MKRTSLPIGTRPIVPSRPQSLRRGKASGSSEVTLLLGMVAAGLISLPIAFSMFGGDPLEGLEEANHGTFEGAGGQHVDPTQNGTLSENELTSNNYPTNGYPSPLYGAGEWEQKMLRFEEFGRHAMPAQFSAGTESFPSLLNAQSCPPSGEIDAYLSNPIFPQPTRLANEVDENPWRSRVEAFLGRPLDTPPCEGRPGGEAFAHQRWAEFTPQIYFQSCMTGARTSTSLRDGWQMHGWSSGEWGPGGLYHVCATGNSGTNAGIPVRFHPNMPSQDPLALWTFDGTLPPKLLMAKYGEPILFRHFNMLPIDPAANRGFGIHTITTHEHNGHHPAESDGFTNAFFFPGQYYDYRWPLVHAGYDSINTNASDPRCGTPDGNGGITNLRGDWRETMSTHWFHDHMLDFTAQNVYKGNAAMMNYYSSVDRGNEAIDDGVNLRFPSGTALDWGNRDYDVNLVIADKAWDREGQLWFNVFNTDGFLGDQMLVNWQYRPYFDVRARKYRFRILNGAVSRYMKFALVDSRGRPVAFHGIANDGNVMEHAVAFDGTRGTQRGVLPLQSIAERWDIIVDFSQFRPGEKLYLLNTVEHDTGKRPEDNIPIRDIMGGRYRPFQRDDDGDGLPDRWVGGDPCVGKILEFRVKAYSGTDLSMNPANYVAGQQKMIPLNRASASELANARHRTFEFGRSGGTDGKPWTIETDDGDAHTADPRRVSAAPTTGSLEIWTIRNGTGGGWSHPVHVHFEEGIYLSRDGETPPEWERWARKDMYRIGPHEDSSREIEVQIRIREFGGTYVEHCHNTQHEDTAMLLRWDSEQPGQLTRMPCPIPTWDGCEAAPSVALPTALTGDGFGPNTRISSGSSGSGSSGSGSGRRR